MNVKEENYHPFCEYADCEERGEWDDDYKTYLCTKHVNCVENTTGYCSMDCQLGYGCDGSC